jgi:hypothetical protein
LLDARQARLDIGPQGLVLRPEQASLDLSALDA